MLLVPPQVLFTKPACVGCVYQDISGCDTVEPSAGDFNARGGRSADKHPGSSCVSASVSALEEPQHQNPSGDQEAATLQIRGERVYKLPAPEEERPSKSARLSENEPALAGVPALGVGSALETEGEAALQKGGEEREVSSGMQQIVQVEGLLFCNCMIRSPRTLSHFLVPGVGEGIRTGGRRGDGTCPTDRSQFFGVRAALSVHRVDVTRSRTFVDSPRPG